MEKKSCSRRKSAIRLLSKPDFSDPGFQVSQAATAKGNVGAQYATERRSVNETPAPTGSAKGGLLSETEKSSVLKVPPTEAILKVGVFKGAPYLRLDKELVFRFGVREGTEFVRSIEPYRDRLVIVLKLADQIEEKLDPASERATQT